MTDLQAVGSAPLSSFVSIDDDAVDRETTSFSNGNEVDGKIIRMYKRKLVPCRPGIAMVVFASLAAVAVLIVKCATAFRREREESAIERNLSEKREDSSDPEDGVECALGEGSEGLSLPQESTSAGGQEEDVEPPSAKRPKLDSSSADGGAGETSRTRSETDAASGLLALSQQQPAPAPSSETHVARSQQSAEEESPRTAGEAAAAAGLLMLGQQPPAPSPSSETHAPLSQQSAQVVTGVLPAILWPPQPSLIVLNQGGSPGHPLPSTSAGGVEAPSDGVASAGSSQLQPQQQGLKSSAEERPREEQQQEQKQQQQQEQLQQQPQASLSPSALEAGETSAPSASPASPSSPQPSTSSGLLAQRRDSPAAGRLHVFARLPTVTDPNHGVVFNLGRACIIPTGFSDAYETLQEMRTLLAQDSLSTQELTELVRMSEKLASHILSNERLDTSHMPLTGALEVLGRRFMFIDTIICTFLLLGARPKWSWWNHVIGGIPHSVSVRGLYRPKFDRDRQQFRKGLMEKLSVAVGTMKRGTRLSTRELVDLKRSLLCSPLTLPIFQKGQWDPWRQDDKEAIRNSYTDA